MKLLVISILILVVLLFSLLLALVHVLVLEQESVQESSVLLEVVQIQPHPKLILLVQFELLVLAKSEQLVLPVELEPQESVPVLVLEQVQLWVQQKSVLSLSTI